MTAHSRTAEASKREVQVQRLAAIARSIAKAAFMHSSQRKGSCTKRSLGKCCQNKLLTESMRTALRALQAESSIHGLWSAATPVALRATGQPRACPELVEGAAVPTRFFRQLPDTQIAKTRMTISASATVETRRLKRL